MTDFCLQCSINMFDEDTGDHKGHSTEEDTKNGLFTIVICESCGIIQVDHTGRCVSPDCNEQHGALI